jgi:transcription termination factor Rho
MTSKTSREQATMSEETIGTGVLEILPNGSGLLRRGADFAPSSADAYVAPAQIRRFNLRPGHAVTGAIRPPRGGERYHSLLRVDAIEGEPPERAARWPEFSTLTAETPHSRLRLENGSDRLGVRAIDLLAPVGKGQRGLIVAPPYAGKTRFLSEIAVSVATRYPEIALMLLLIDERPEEVTDLRRAGAGQVIASSFDSDSQNHLRVAELTLARAQRLVEAGRDVFLLVDSLTRLARSSNLAISGSGRTLTGGLDPAALRFPRKMFGAARAVEGGGSLTLFATALVDTGSRLDDLIFEEFKGTGNWELKLDRRLAERRLFPAIDIAATSARGEERLYDEDELRAVHRLRRHLQESHRAAEERAAQFLAYLEKTPDNANLLRRVLGAQG